jgi:hypothetical protein
LEASSPRIPLQLFAAGSTGKRLWIVFGGARVAPAEWNKVLSIVGQRPPHQNPNKRYCVLKQSNAFAQPTYLGRYPALFSGDCPCLPTGVAECKGGLRIELLPCCAVCYPPCRYQEAFVGRRRLESSSPSRQLLSLSVDIAVVLPCIRPGSPFFLDTLQRLSLDLVGAVPLVSRADLDRACASSSSLSGPQTTSTQEWSESV